MAGKAKEGFLILVRKLVNNLTNFHEDEDNFDLCERYVISNLHNHRFLSVDSHAVRRTIDGLVTKFEVHGHINTSRKFSELVKEFLGNEVFLDHPQCDIQWSLLSLLLLLSDNPTARAYNLTTSPSNVKDPDEEGNFDWVSYLREGDDQFFCDYGDSSSEESDIDLDESNETHGSIELNTLQSGSLSSEVESIKISKEGFVQNVKDICAAEEWLKENIQDPWWLSEEINATTLSRFPAANFAKFREQQLCSQNNNQEIGIHVSTLSEYKVIREILWMFITPSTMYLFKEENMKFVVKENITIPSITKEVFLSYMNRLCFYFDIVKDLKKFGEELSCGLSDNSKILPPNTFMAYWSAIEEFFRDFNNLIIDIEKKVRKQEGSYTLLRLMNDLEPKLIDLHCIYSVHIRAVYDWRFSPSWLSSSCLLSVMYEAMVDSSVSNHATIMLKIFLKTSQIYLDIIDMWLTEGQLHDLREEFVISRDCGDSDEEFMVRPYRTMLKGSGIEPLPILEVIVNNAQQIGKSIDLLLKLGRLSELKNVDNTRGRLYEELIKGVEGDLSEYVAKKDDIILKESFVTEIECYVHNENVATSFLSEVKEHLLRAGDPFLIKGFEDYLHLDDSQDMTKHKNTVKWTKSCEQIKQLYSRLTNCFNDGIIPIKQILEKNFLRLIEAKWKMACSMVKPIFQQEFNLAMHFRVIRGVFLMEASDLMHQFNSSLFEQIKFCEANSFSLTMHLKSCVDIRYPDFSSHLSVIVDSNIQYATSVLDAIDSIRLRYTVEWPLSLILNECSMDYYNNVFQFLLKIKWAVFSLHNTRFSDLQEYGNLKIPVMRESNRVLRLQCLRFWLLHSVSSVHNYLMGQVLHLLSLELERNIEEANCLDAIIRAHTKYVETVYEHCLQTEDGQIIKRAILKMISTALRLCEYWGNDKAFTTCARLQELKELYTKCHVFLAVILSNSVENDSRSHLASLSAAFNATLPQLRINYSKSLMS